MNSLETKRLRLKNYTEKEKEDFIALFSNEVVMKRVDRGVLTCVQAEKLWRKLLKEFYPEGKTTIWAVFAKDDSRYIGHAAIRPRPQKPADWEVSYVLCEKDWGKGFATEIARRLIEYGFGELKLTEVFATIDDDNLSSIKVSEKAGMSFLHYEFDDDGRFSVFSKKKN